MACGRLDILRLYGAHDPYGIDHKSANLQRSWLDGSAAKSFVPLRTWFADPALRTRLRHTYDNAVISLDLMLDALDKGRSAAERLIVMVFDHGATLSDSPALATRDLEIH